MSSFFIVCRKVPHHLLDLTKLSIGEKFSNVASAMAEQATDVQKEIRTRLEKSNARYKADANKRRIEGLRRRHRNGIFEKRKNSCEGLMERIKEESNQQVTCRQHLWPVDRLLQ